MAIGYHIIVDTCYSNTLYYSLCTMKQCIHGVVIILFICHTLFRSFIPKLEALLLSQLGTEQHTVHNSLRQTLIKMLLHTYLHSGLHIP